MRVRLIQVTLRKSGARSRRGRLVDTAQVTIGRGTDNVLVLGGIEVPLHHSVLTESSDGIRVEAMDVPSILVNGRLRPVRAFGVGDELAVGPYRVRGVEPEGDETLALEYEKVAPVTSDLEALERHTRRGLERGWASRRRLSFAALAAILGLGLALPLARDRLGFLSEPGPARDLAQLSSRSWSSGPLSNPHGNLGDDCATCHVEPFTPVRDAECRACHEAIGRHGRPTAHAARFDELRCADCHEEHRGDVALAAIGSALCVDCHADVRKHFARTDLLPVSGFTEGHPGFRPTVVTDPEEPRLARIPLDDLVVRGPVGDLALQERSGLRFPHRVHLGDDLRGSDGERTRLDCDACHRPDRTGRLMEPIRFEDHCQECHRLAFEPLDPTREVPHENPDLVVRHVFEYYAGAALRGNIEDRAAEPRARRRPGSRLTEAEREKALDWANRRAFEANALLFGERGLCRQCHVLEADETGVSYMEPVAVLPEPEAPSWMRLARFDHEPHRMLDCIGCHPARQSENAGNVMLPDVDNCRTCHGDTGAVGEVPARCVSCHDFHQARFGEYGTGDSSGR